MRMKIVISAVAAVCWLAAAAADESQAPRPASQIQDDRFSPYCARHRSAVEPTAPHTVHGGRRRTEANAFTPTDPLLFDGGTFLLEGESHRRAITLLDEFLNQPGESTHEPLKRLFLQRDLWAAFDYAAWYPDEWVHYSRNEAAAIVLRNRLAKAIGRLALTDDELAALPDNYALAVKSNKFARARSETRGKPFLPADLFDPKGPWVRFHDDSGKPMAERHFEGVGGRAAHIIYLRLPAGRAATERYLKDLKDKKTKQFPTGTMVAMVRRHLRSIGQPKSELRL